MNDKINLCQWKASPNFCQLWPLQLPPSGQVHTALLDPALEANPGKMFSQEEEELKIQSPWFMAFNQPRHEPACYGT